MDACADYADKATELLGLRLASVFGILAVSSIGVLIPLFTYRAERTTIYFFLRAFAGGVVLCTGFVHVLGDAVEALTDPCLGLSGEYPWAYVFATAAALLTFCVEFFLQRYFRYRLGLPQTFRVHAHSMSYPAEELPAKEAAVAEPAVVCEECAPQPIEDPQEAARIKAAEVEHLDATATVYTLEGGIIFHSIFIGITLGASSGADTIRSLMIALMFHQGNEGLALGVTYCKAGFRNLKYLLFGLAFVLVTPIGCAIGMGIGASYNRASATSLGFQGAFDALSAGILIYNGLVDLIIPTFTDGDMPKAAWLQGLGFASLFSGAAVMSLIAKWA